MRPVALPRWTEEEAQALSAYLQAAWENLTAAEQEALMARVRAIADRAEAGGRRPLPSALDDH